MLLIQSVVEEPSYQIKSPMRLGLLIAAAQAGPDQCEPSAVNLVFMDVTNIFS